MFAVIVTFRVLPGYFGRFLPLMEENARKSLSLEPGCRVFDVCTDPDRPDEIFLYELYDDAEAFQTHLESAHFKAFDAEVAAMVADKQVATYREVRR